MNNKNLATLILEKASTKDDGDDYEKMAKKEAGEALLRAIENSDGEAIADALGNLYQVSVH